MKILSVDIGIKNLAACYIDFSGSSHTITDWRVINCANSIMEKQLKCCVVRRGKVCNKFATCKVVKEGKEFGY